MVNLLPPALVAWLAFAGPVLADVAVPPRKLEGPLKAKVLAALAGLIILGFAMMALTWMGGYFTRRYMHSGPPRRDPPRTTHDDDWAEKPLNGPLEGPDDEA